MPKTRKERISAAAVIVVVLLFGFLYWRYHPRWGTVSFFPQYNLTLKDYAGNDVRLSSFKREPIVVFAWASWCVYCSDELKNLATLKKKYGDKIHIVAPNRAESLPDAKLYSDALGLGNSITYLLDPADSYYKSITGYAMPETIFVNDHGEVVFHQRGPMTIDEVEANIRTLLK
jgi:cytochrome c biogenesis protein CcmG/thiol:disulfide interchange protein DsbE